MPLSIKLVVPAPAALKWPSIGLTQLKAILGQQFPDGEVHTEVIYSNFLFAEYIGWDAYNLFTRSRLSKGYNYLEWYFEKLHFLSIPITKRSFSLMMSWIYFNWSPKG